MKLGIVTVTYNSADVLEEYARHVQRLSVEEIVVIDNASQDESARLASEFASTVVRSESNAGFGRACNVGASAARSADALLFLNPDCYLTPEALASMVEVLEKRQDVGAVSPGMRYPNGKVGISGGGGVSLVKEWLGYLRLEDWTPIWIRRVLRSLHGSLGWPSFTEYALPTAVKREREVGWLSGFCLLVRRTALEAVGGFDERFFLYFEDVDLSRRLRQNGWTLISVESASATHMESTSTSKAGKSAHYYKGMSTYYRIHGSVMQRMSARLLRRVASR